jgi:hypothetical protein
VRESVDQPAPRELLDDPAADRLIQGAKQLGLGQTGSTADDVELELGARRRREVQQNAGRGREPRQPFAHDLANAVRSSQGRERTRQTHHSVDHLHDLGLAERAPELAHQERVAIGQLDDGGGQLGEIALDPPLSGALDELDHRIIGESRQT